MKVYAITIHYPTDGKEISSIHVTRKGALQSACKEMLEMVLSYDAYEDESLTWVEENLCNLNKDHRLTIAELDKIFEYAEELLWEVGTEVEIVWHPLQP